MGVGVVGCEFMCVYVNLCVCVCACVCVFICKRACVYKLKCVYVHLSLILRLYETAYDILLHTDNAAYAWRLKNSGVKAWTAETVVAPGAAKGSKSVYKERFESR